ncbi:MAG: lipid A biosynthesis acyltransferase [Thiobacillus sp.]|nr:lipid A biosynthesis acyltransferase [Thiobacillus sp.]
MKPSQPGLFHPRLLPTWLGVGVLWLLHWLPLPVLAGIGNLLGSLVAALPLKRRRVAETNLRLCFPEQSEAVRARWVRANFRASARAALEHSVLSWGSASRVRRLVRVEHPERMLGDGQRPVIWLAPHFVGLNMCGIRLSMDVTGVSMYVRALNPVMDKLILHIRTRFSKTILVPRHQGIKPVIRALKSGHPLYYLPDQDQGRKDAVFVPFFGIATATVSALPRLAKVANAQVVPVTTRQLPGGGGYVVTFHPAWENYPTDDLEADVARMNRWIEDRVREMPEQYLWLHRRFKTRPPGESSPYA